MFQCPRELKFFLRPSDTIILLSQHHGINPESALAPLHLKKYGGLPIFPPHDV